MSQKNKTNLEDELGVHFDLDPVFNPKSMVVVGVSQTNYLNPGTIIFLKNVFEMNLGEHTYGVNPRGGIIESQKLYTKIADLPEVPDVAVMAIHPNYTLTAIKDCIDLGVKGFIVISGGFAEIGKEGAELQDKMANLCYDSATPLIGPNCVGVFHPPVVDTLFLSTEKLVLPEKGNVAIISQSGGIMLDQFFLSFKERNIGVSKAVSIGNKAVINEVHLLDYFSKDPETDCVTFYQEGFDHLEGKRFIDTSMKTKKDIVIYQGGKSSAGKKAVSSHTASISTDFGISHAAFKQFGIIQPQTEEEMLNYVKTYSVLASSKRPLSFRKAMKGNVAILTVSGGHGVVCTDLLDKYDLHLVKFEKYEIDIMKSLVDSNVSRMGAFSNPIDLTGAVGDDDIVKVLDYLLQLEKIDIIITIVVPYPPEISVQIGRRIALVAGHHSTPLVCFVPYIEKYDLIRGALDLSHIPVAHTVSETVEMAAAIRDKSRAILRLKENRMRK